METITVRDLKDIINNLYGNKEVVVTNSYSPNEIKVELIKELRPIEREYYKITL